MHFTAPHSNSTAARISTKATAGIDRATSTAHQAVDRLAETAASAAESLGRTGDQLLATQDRWVGAARSCVRDHPLASVGIALGIGLLLSRLTTMRDDEY